MVYVNVFDKVAEKDVEFVGIKGVNVSNIYKKYNTPKGFIVNTGAFSSFIERSNAKSRITELVSKLKKDNIQAIANDIQKIIVETSYPEFISREISDSYLNLGKDLKVKDDLSVSIRPSYVKEIDHPLLNQLTFLNVKGKDNILMAIKVAWAAQFTYKNMLAREELKIGHNVSNAIIVQAMVYPDKSILAYSYNPEDGDSSKIGMKAISGIGEGFMYTDTPFDFYTIDKKDFSISSKFVANQHFGYALNPKNNKIAKFMLGKREDIQKLTDSEIVEVAKFVDSMTKDLKTPVRVEIGVSGEKVHIFQIKNSRDKVVIPKILPITEDSPIVENEIKIEEKTPEVLKVEKVNEEEKVVETTINSSFEKNEELNSGKTLLEIAEDEVNDEEKAFDKDFEDAYIELKDIKSDFKELKSAKEEEKESLVEESREDEFQADDFIFSNVKIDK